ncbi:bifunctional NAD(P)/FAD-dependent oxidoreductase/class I SAM-dependent methyltransferase [Nocardioides acrostichi]|uniref:NAD(P)/FAD-dependent oxidoreductase n=1 Tax=Nocardioides acrostichi TaxID=2784339 RepID=A0A930V194_9ACTN|nr:bifunctional NAD(P)/FAD-dependent oxidoreductase/class I SAM-dependent methyltransferase [Nocardioides acrostichi]MBF4162835.1 NAD(P)/FAD-dependent oxidoreductase [Nocardioides acrostichi]
MSHQHAHSQPHAPLDIPRPNADYDAVIVGGGAAGLSGALALARARRRVLVVDSGDPRNAAAHAVHNFLTRDGTPPSELYAAGRAEVAGYGGETIEGRVASVRAWGEEAIGFVVGVEAESGSREVTTRRLLVATGASDALPDVPGLRERWGRDVVHCPYCHGYEVADRRIVVVGTSPMAGHAGLLWRQWSQSVTLLVDPAVAEAGLPDPHEGERLEAMGVVLDEGRVVEVLVEDDAVTGVRLDDDRVVEADIVVWQAEVLARSEVLEHLGIAAVPMEVAGARIASQVPVTPPAGATSVPGVFAAGNVAEPMAQVVHAAAAGTWAGAMINADLVREDADRAVAASRAEFFEQPAWEERYGQRDNVWSGKVNAVLATEAVDLVPGRALDIGSGEGGDALWLAEHGWEVTGCEFSSTGRARAAAEADSRGLTDRVEWRAVDVREFSAEGEAWDLVTCHFLHLPDGGMLDVTRRLAEAVAPGGTLLVVGHHPDMMKGPRGRHAHTAEQLGPVLTSGEWAEEWSVTTETRARTALARDGSGEEMTFLDAVLIARRAG